MKSITYIGMDVHTTNYTLCCYSVEDDRYFAEMEIKPDYREVLKYINRIQSQRGEGMEVLCGYEAGSLGYIDLSDADFDGYAVRQRQI